MSDVLTIEDLQTAKKHDTFHNEVITGKAGGLSTGDDIDTATNAVTGQVQKTLPKILRDLGMMVQAWTATTGGTLTDASQVFLNDITASAGNGNYYAWTGTFPKTVAPGTDPAAVAGFVMRSDAGLRSELSAIDGAGFVGGALYSDIRAYNGSRSRVYCLGRASMFDGAHGWFKRIASSKTDNDGVYIVDALGRTWERENNEEVNPVWFGALPLGGGDSLAALTAAVNFASTRGGYVPPIVRIPGGNYTINGMFELFDLAQATIIMDGPIFSGVGAAALDAVVRINNASNLKIVGSCTISANYLSNYASALSVTASPGGLIKPDTGIVSHVDVFGVTVRESLVGFKLGAKALDTQIAELQFHGCESMFCPVCVYNGGSQTGATFSACTLASSPGMFALTSKFRILDMDGGLVQIVGGEFINSGVPVGASNHAAIEFKPAKSATYSNPFGTLKISGAHIELTSPLLSIGSGGVALPIKSVDANVGVSNCSGFIEQVTGGDFISIFEPTFSGLVCVDDACNFYTTQTRTGFNVSAASAVKARLSIGKTCFGAGFKDWMGGTVGGILYHPLTPVASVSNTSQVFPSGSQTVVKLTAVSGAAGMSRYGVYSTTTGEIAIPPGCRNMVVKFNAQGSGFTGDLFIQKNGAGILQFATIGSGGVASLTFEANQPTPGDKYQLVMNPSSGPITLNGARMDVHMEF